jgi:tRNA dimethylallyltransferase
MAAVAPLIVILGETASGKTAAGIELAKKVSGEIICADSRTIYKGMDIGTAKPSKEEQDGVVHHLLNVVEPDERFNVAQFKKLADEKIYEIWERGNVPIMVGGTGLYIDSVIFNYQFSSTSSEKDPGNSRHLLNGGQKDNVLRDNTWVSGLTVERELLKERITQRVAQMFKDGFLDEAQRISDEYGWKNESMSGIGYRVARSYFEGESSKEEVMEAFAARDVSLAKRQRTWFKRNPHIKWFESADRLIQEATEFASRFKV